MPVADRPSSGLPCEKLRFTGVTIAPVQLCAIKIKAADSEMGCS